MAWFYRFDAMELRPEDATAYEKAENAAKASKVGLWADASPMPPWEFRQGGKAAKAAVSKPPAFSGPS
jgi:endonuclease YncB( thermonuclease family)